MESTDAESHTPTRFEFAPEQDQVIRRAGYRTRVWGWVSLAGGLLLAALAVMDLASADRAGAGTAIIYGLLALIPIFVGYQFVRSGGELVAVATTRGSDVLHLMRSLDGLSRAFLVQIIAALVWVVLGVAAALTMPGVSGDRAVAYTADQRADLLNLALLQEHYHHATDDDATYTVNLLALGFRPGPGVTVTISDAGPAGWAATSTHEATPDRGCAIFVGDAEPAPTPGGRAPEEPGRPVCDE